MEKLTKQQKRDLKRNQSNSIEGNIHQHKTTKQHNSTASSRSHIEGSSVYKRKPAFPEICSNLKNVPSNRFIQPKDGPIFQKLLQTSYKGFEVLNANEFDSSYSSRFQSSLETLEELDYYRFDVIQPTGLGSKLAKTFVSRCLVGEPGITYKYLGNRMFAYPWDKNAIGSHPALVDVGNLNNKLISKTRRLLNTMNNSNSTIANNNSNNNNENDSNVDTGSCEYNLTLINRCFPVGAMKMKDEPMFEKDKVSVSWHADSSLEHYSSIAVYHFTKSTKTAIGKIKGKSHVNHKAPNKEHSNNTNNNNNVNEDDIYDVDDIVITTNHSNATKAVVDDSWRIAFKVLPNAEGPNAQKMKPASSSADSINHTNSNNNDSNKLIASLTSIPPIAIPLPSESTYFLLDEFNHHHQHAVLAGQTDRYSSTHRVSRVDGHTYFSIKQKCISALQGSGLDAKQVRSEQLALTELEFEWIRQYYVQGTAHHSSHVWWHEPMQTLLTLWLRLEQRTAYALQALIDAASGIFDDSDSNSFSSNSNKRMMKRRKRADEVQEKSYDEMMEALNERRGKRHGWQQRYQDDLWEKIPSDCQPMVIPFSLDAQWWLQQQQQESCDDENEENDDDEVNDDSSNDLKKLEVKMNQSNDTIRNKNKQEQSNDNSDGDSNNDENENNEDDNTTITYDPSTIEWLERLDEITEQLDSWQYMFIDLKRKRKQREVKKEKSMSSTTTTSTAVVQSNNNSTAMKKSKKVNNNNEDENPEFVVESKNNRNKDKKNSISSDKNKKTKRKERVNVASEDDDIGVDDDDDDDDDNFRSSGSGSDKKKRKLNSKDLNDKWSSLFNADGNNNIAATTNRSKNKGSNTTTDSLTTTKNNKHVTNGAAVSLASKKNVCDVNNLGALLASRAAKDNKL